jgi:hypothetical protein
MRALFDAVFVIVTVGVRVNMALGVASVAPALANCAEALAVWLVAGAKPASGELGGGGGIICASGGADTPCVASVGTDFFAKGSATAPPRGRAT